MTGERPSEPGPVPDPEPGAETVAREFIAGDPGPIETWHQPTPSSPIFRRIGPGPIKFAGAAVLIAAIVILLAETF